MCKLVRHIKFNGNKSIHRVLYKVSQEQDGFQYWVSGIATNINEVCPQFILNPLRVYLCVP